MVTELVDLSAIEIETGLNPSYTIIWLHGLGADGNDFVPIVNELERFLNNKPVRFIFPHAPERPVTINNGYIMRAWYDILYPDMDSHQDRAGIGSSQLAIDNLIAREMRRGVAPKHIVLAGFSQGGAMALHVGLRQSNQLAGIVALSCYLLEADSFASEARVINAKIPIFMAHGTYDAVIPLRLATDSRNQLLAANYAVSWHEYPMAHSVCSEEVVDIGNWLRQVID